MSDKERQILKRFSNVIKDLNEIEKERIVATAEGMAIMKKYIFTEIRNILGN